jgi:peroxiredoxin
MPMSRSRMYVILCLGGILSIPASFGAEGPPASSVAEIQARHDRALIRDLEDYLRKNPKADDLEQAYMTLFNKVMEHDWFAEHEELAKRYLAENPEGAVNSLARIVATMARAQAGRFDEALTRYRELMRGLGDPEQVEFATSFADTLALAATTEGQNAVARQVYETLLEIYGESEGVREKVEADLARLDKVGKPAPSVAAKDLKGEPFRLQDLKGKYVLVDFWATWCAPCVAEIPRLREAYGKYREGGLEVVGISLDEEPDAVTDFVKSRQIGWRQIHNASGGGDFVDAFGVTTIPATFLIDPQGVITRLDLRGPALDRTLAKLIKSPAAKAEPPAR